MQSALLKWTNLAELDLEKIEAYIAEDNSPIVAIDEIVKVIDNVHLILSKYPRAGRYGRVKNTRELVIAGLPFFVVYREDLSINCLEVLRVLHESQHWPMGE